MVHGRPRALRVTPGAAPGPSGVHPVRPSEVLMPVPFQRPRALVLLLALTAAALLLAATSAMASPGGALYTQTNDPAGNTVQRFDRGADGSLSSAGTYATGGVG